MKTQISLRAIALVGGLALAPALAPLPAFAVDTMSVNDKVDLTAVRAKLKAKDYIAALNELRDLAEDNQQADVYNLLRFALRKTGDYSTALTYYTKALELDPNHKGAHEYLGELYAETGNISKAREQLATLVRLCPRGCEEREDLQRALGNQARN